MAKGESYEQFIAKFNEETPKTTDDCYTPQGLYEDLSAYIIKKFNLENNRIVRPFYPGGDYEHYNYKPEDVVIDNPPFSILSHICRFYDSKNIKYFLFAPTLTLFNVDRFNCNYYPGGAILYDNGASVNTSFVTNLGSYKIVVDANISKIIKKYAKKPKIRNVYPLEVVTSTKLLQLGERGYNINIGADEVAKITKANGLTIYGSGVLINKETGKKIDELRKTLLPTQSDPTPPELEEKLTEKVKQLKKGEEPWKFTE